MSVNATLRRDSTTSATVIPFPRKGASAVQSLDRDLAVNLPGLLEIADELKAVFEARITEAYFRTVLSLRTQPDDPFDPVYISRLTPDPVRAADIAQLRRFAAIRDLSEEIDFRDEWSD